MGAWEVWLGSGAAVLTLLTSVYLAMLLRAFRNQRVIDTAIMAMEASLTAEPAPQRALLSAVADTLAAQERAAARIELAVHELALGSHQVPQSAEFLHDQSAELLQELLDVPEPQRLITDFLGKYGGGPGSEAVFDSISADLLRAATAEVFADLAGRRPAELDRLLVLATEGSIAAVALAGLDALSAAGPLPYRAPRVADLDAPAMVAIVRALDRTTRRYLRLATLLHGQAESILRIRPDGLRDLAALRAHVRQLVRFPRVWKPEFQPGDLAALVVALDAVGEIIDTAAERLAEGKLAHAAHLLAGLRVPGIAGMPGRIYHQESLAQVRPLAAFGVWHRLAVARWATSALQAIVPDELRLATPADPPPGHRIPSLSTRGGDSR